MFAEKSEEIHMSGGGYSCSKYTIHCGFTLHDYGCGAGDNFRWGFAINNCFSYSDSAPNTSANPDTYANFSTNSHECADSYAGTRTASD